MWPLIAWLNENKIRWQNEGITRDVDENKGPVFQSFGITQDVYEK
jgi:hypothetical protein